VDYDDDDDDDDDEEITSFILRDIHKFNFDWFK
jgi:hypothetical protein